MKKINDICFIIQARLNSKRVPKKMIRPFAGTTLLDISFQKVLDSKIPKNQFFFCAYENELLDISKKYHLNTFKRSKESAEEENSLQRIYEWHNKLGEIYKYAILINACVPFLEVKTINRFIDSYRKSNEGGMFGVIEKKNYFWNKKKEMISHWPKEQKIMNTKTCGITYEAAHVLYAGKIDIIKDGYWMDDKIPPSPDLFIMNEKECFDVDYEWQFKYAEAIQKYEHRR